MKKSLFSCLAVLFAFSTVGCQPPATETPDVSTDVSTTAPADSNVTATAETPAVTETPAAEEAPAEAATE